MNRRHFLTLFGFAIISILALQFLSFTFQGLLMVMIRNDIKGLGFRNGDIENFLSDAKDQNIWKQFSTGKRILIYVHYYSPFKKIIPYYWKYKQYRGFITGQFLLSTNYYWRNNQSDIPLKYLGIRSPYQAPCQHPFFNL